MGKIVNSELQMRFVWLDACLFVCRFPTSIGYSNQKGKKYWRNISTSLVAVLLCEAFPRHISFVISSAVPRETVLTIWQAMKINLQCVKSYTYYRFCDVCTQFSNWTVCCNSYGCCCCCYVFAFHCMAGSIRSFHHCVSLPLPLYAHNNVDNCIM